MGFAVRLTLSNACNMHATVFPIDISYVQLIISWKPLYDNVRAYIPLLEPVIDSYTVNPKY